MYKKYPLGTEVVFANPLNGKWLIGTVVGWSAKTPDLIEIVSGDITWYVQSCLVREVDV